MSIEEQIKNYLDSQPEAKRNEMLEVHQAILQISPLCKLWFLDGKDAQGKVVTNPNIGYGSINLKYKDGSTKEFYQVGLSGNTTGISIYIMGIDDKSYLLKTFGNTIEKAIVTGYCIKFKTIKDINIDVLKEAIHYGFDNN